MARGGRRRGGRPGARDFKIQNPRQTIKRILKLFSSQGGRILFVAFLLIIAAILAIAAPMLLRRVMNGISVDLSSLTDSGKGVYFELVDQGEGSALKVIWSSLLLSFGIIIFSYIVNAFVRWLANWIIAKISAYFAYGLGKTFKEKLDRLPLAFFDRQTFGEILSRGTNDIATISGSLSEILFQIVLGISMFIGGLIAMFVTDWRLALVALGTVPVSLLIAGFISMFSQKQFIKFQMKIGHLESHVEETLSGYDVIKLFNQEERVIDVFNEINDDLRKTEFFAHWISAIVHPALRFVSNIGYVIICVVGGLVSDVPTIIAFLMVLNLFLQPIHNIGGIVSSVQMTLAAAERVFEVMDEKEMEPDPVDALNDESGIRGEFVFENVDFSYVEDQPLIKDMNLHVNPGDTVAIVGPTGAGKTTLVNLIMRFYEIQGGSIKLDGVDLRNYTRGTLRGSVGMVLQDTWLFNGSIKNNIKYGHTDATDEEVIEAAKAAHADHFIQTLPGGYEFVLNEDGTNISLGQRQLITIARAMISQPKILILDEATSSVDTRTESLVQKAMDRLMEGKTAFVIAHRLSTIKNAKTIIVMNKGDIVETGNHQELLALDGFYAELYNAQFMGTNPMETKEEIIDY
ncbi:MAG: ABC transporter ATP-binding protein [Syntrophomonadaceae bacterium]